MKLPGQGVKDSPFPLADVGRASCWRIAQGAPVWLSLVGSQGGYVVGSIALHGRIDMCPNQRGGLL